MRALSWIDRWIFETYSPCARGLPLFRIVFSLYLLVFYMQRYGQLAGMPTSFFHPILSMTTVIPGLPPGWFYHALDFFLELGALCLLFGFRTRFTSFALFAVIITGNTYRYSVGPKVDHDILVPATLFCLAFSGWGNRLSRDSMLLSRDKRRSTSSWPISLLVLIVGFCMFTAAQPKAMSGWLNPHFYASYGHMLSYNLTMEKPLPLGNLLLHVHSPLFWKMADWSTLAIEGSFILCIFSLTASRVIAAFAVIFHAMIFYSMGIFFSSNLVAYACLLDFRRFLWNARIRHGVGWFGGLAHQIKFPQLFVLATAMWGIRSALQGSMIDPATLLNNLSILSALLVAVTSLLYYLASYTDRFVFNRTFPLPAPHSLVILYDGECGLCDKWVQFVLQHDRRGAFRFAPLQSSSGKELLQASGGPGGDMSTMILIIDQKAYLRSTGALVIFRQLGGPWSLLGVLGLVPRPVRDLVYSIVAANRHRLFPKTGDTCRLPGPSESKRFLS